MAAAVAAAAALVRPCCTAASVRATFLGSRVAGRGAVSVHTTRSVEVSETEAVNPFQTPLTTHQRQVRAHAATDALLRASVVMLDADLTATRKSSLDVVRAACLRNPVPLDLTADEAGGAIAIRDAWVRCGATRGQLEELAAKFQPPLSPNVASFVKHLRQRGAQVFLVAHEPDIFVERVATRIGVPNTNVVANACVYDGDGPDAVLSDFAPLDVNPRGTMVRGGKGAIAAALKAQFDGACVVMIGDGVDDMHARGDYDADVYDDDLGMTDGFGSDHAAFTRSHADAVIGFGGVVTDPMVKDSADLFVTSFDALLRVVVQQDEPQRPVRLDVGSR